MQRMTTIHTTRRFGDTAMLAGLLTLVLAAGAVLIALWWVNQPGAPAAPASSQAVSQPLSRSFADQAADAPSVAEYAALGESYLPPATVQTSRSAPASRSFADQAADVASVAEYAALGEDYLAQPAVSAHTPRQASIPRIFADEALGGATLGQAAILTSVGSPEVTPAVGPR